ncbi:MAG: ATP-binding protein, partial [Byssovorax sp.]
GVTNEELQSTNEELQSSNEEIQTAKEELQSTNEELSSLNEELQTRNTELNSVNSDLVNILGSVEVAIVIVDAARHIRRFTPKARSILNVLPSDVGRPLHDIRVNISVSDLDERIRVAMDTNLMHESEVQDRDGRWYRMQIRPYKTTDNRIDGATLSFVDIDVLKRHLAAAQQAKDDAERANRAKDQFLAILSHELRTPLGVMLLHSQLLCQDGMDPKVKRAGAAIERATNTQTQLIDDLLDVSRIVTGKLLIDIQVVDLCAVVRAALEAVSPMAERKAMRMDVALDESMGRVSGDPARLQQVVSNLLTNAIKFTPQGGRVTVSLEAVGGYAHLTVSDTGVGIAASFLPHVFNRFTQEDGSSTRAHGGLGLGLAIVRHLIEAHQGTVEAQSPGPGKGTTMSILLPLATAGADARDAGHPSSSRREASIRASSRVTVDAARLNNLRVLVVDDDLGTREAVAEMLRRAGADVRMAESTAAALTAVDEFRPEVLLCDIAMPHEDG